MGYEDRYDPDADFDRWYTVGTARAIAPWLVPGDAVLELGCATGLMSADLVAAGATLVGIDRSASYLERAGQRSLPDATFVQADVTTLALGRTFDHVVAANVLHEVPDPAALLEVAARHLRPGGHVHLTVPNPRSLHRLIGVEMGLLADVTDLSERARSLETLWALDAEVIEELAGKVRLRVVHRGGVMLKPWPNQQMAALEDAALEALLLAARFAPELCAMTYVVLQ